MPTTPAGKPYPDNTRHGHSRRGAKTSTYKAWESMIRRCYNITQRAYPNYGGKGITVAPEWFDFATFLRDMGEMPDGLTLERKKSWMDYTPDNCEWASALAQARNKSTTRWLEHAGERLCLTEWAERLNVKPKTLRARLDDHGWSVERALSTPVMSTRESAQNANEAKHNVRKK